MMEIFKKFKFPILIVFVYIGLAVWIPDAASRSSIVTIDYFKEMALIMPPVFIMRSEEHKG